MHAPHAEGEVAPTSGKPIGDFNDYPVLGAGLCPSLGYSAGECLAGFWLDAPRAPLKATRPWVCPTKEN